MRAPPTERGGERWRLALRVAGGVWRGVCAGARGRQRVGCVRARDSVRVRLARTLQRAQDVAHAPLAPRFRQWRAAAAGACGLKDEAQSVRSGAAHRHAAQPRELARALLRLASCRRVSSVLIPLFCPARCMRARSIFIALM